MHRRHSNLGIQHVILKQYSVKFKAQKATIHQVTIMLDTSKNVLCPGPNHLLTTGADIPTLSLSPSLVLGR